MSRTVVTSYANPDIDRAACMIGYAEYLEKIGKSADWGIFGTPQREPQFVYNYLQINPPLAINYLDKSSKVIIVDGSDIRWIPKEISIDNIVEVIDHRKVNDASKFTYAALQIEYVGAAATLIVEKYIKNNIDVSINSGVFLYAAIVSNTINFKADVTTERDIKASEWLKSKVRIDDSFIREMFIHKSRLDEPLKNILEKEFTWQEFNYKKIGIAQIEIVNVDNLFKQRIKELTQALIQIKEEKSLDYIFLTAIDIEQGTNTFLTIDDESQKIVATSLQVNFEKNIAKKEKVIMRKSIIPLIKEYMESHETSTN